MIKRSSIIALDQSRPNDSRDTDAMRKNLMALAAALELQRLLGDLIAFCYLEDCGISYEVAIELLASPLDPHATKSQATTSIVGGKVSKR